MEIYTVHSDCHPMQEAVLGDKHMNEVLSRRGGSGFYSHRQARHNTW